MNTSSKFTGILAIAALFGIVALIVSLVILNFGGIAAFFIGVIVAIITWIALWLGWGEDEADQSTSGSDDATGMNKPTTGAAPAAPPVVAPDGAKVGSTSAKASNPAAKPALGTAKTAKPAATKATAVKSPASQTAPVAPDGKPATLTAARGSGADDLKLLKGVGPALEKTLNELGFYHFDQVAAWREAEIEWVDSRLKFKGRIVRDDWIKQAETLAEGGETEFSKRAKR